MDLRAHRGISLEAVVSPWPIASSLSSQLGAGDLISLARASTGLRAVLHGFDKPPSTEDAQNKDLDVSRVSKREVRHSLNIGFHDTLYWQRLKEEARFVCSSPTHIRGDKCRACRFCSKPICEACIVRSSFQRGKENTFNNRVRYFCVRCWDEGNVTKTRRFPLTSIRKWYTSSGSVEDHCTCTLKDDGWLCLECKDRQNYQAATVEIKNCHGEGCNNFIGPHHERRRTCLWCQKTLPSPFGGASRHVWTQQMIDAKQRTMQALSADIEEYNRVRLTMMRMTRRQLRGEDAVAGDPEADKPQYVRHLDTINYEHYVGHGAAPTGQEVYDSKRGYWRYNRSFLLKMRCQCHEVSAPCKMMDLQDLASEYARTNSQKFEESLVYDFRGDIEKRVCEDLSDEQKQKFGVTGEHKKEIRGPLPCVFSRNLWRHGTSESRQRVEEWHSLKAHILDAVTWQRFDLLQARVYLWRTYSFWAESAELEIVLTLWGQDFDAIEQPVLPPNLPEREVFQIACQDLTELPIEDFEDNYDAGDLSRLLEEWDKADERMGDLANILNPNSLLRHSNDDSDSASDDMDQETISQLLQAERRTGNAPDTSRVGEEFQEDFESRQHPLDDQEAASSSLKRRGSHTESRKIPTYLEDMNMKLMGGLTQRAGRSKQESNIGIEMTFEHAATAAETGASSRTEAEDPVRESTEMTNDDSGDGAAHARMD